MRERLDQKHVAYSLLKEELADIEKQMEAAQREHDEYRDMLQMLRKEELQARELLKQLKQTIKDRRAAWRKAMFQASRRP